MRILLFALLAATAVPSASALAVQPARPAAGCHIALTASPDAQSFTDAGRNGGAALSQQVATVFGAAATRLCASGAVRPANFARYRSLLVRDAEGATDPNIYDDAEEHAGALILEYAFTDGSPPTQAQVETALRCWRNPNGAGCSAEDMGP